MLDIAYKLCFETKMKKSLFKKFIMAESKLHIRLEYLKRFWIGVLTKAKFGWNINLESLYTAPNGTSIFVYYTKYNMYYLLFFNKDVFSSISSHNEGVMD